MTNEEVEVKQKEEKNVRKKNKISVKFKSVALIIKIIGYGGAIFTALLLILISRMAARGFVLGIVFGLIISLITWFSCLSWEAIAEIIQLLEDIKNK